MVETVLRRLLDHSHRRWIVITVTCVILLAVTWPAVDDYSAAKVHRRELVTSLESTRESVGRKEQFEKKVKQQVGLLSEVEQRLITEDRVEQFRGEVVQLVRDSGCRLSRLRVDQPQQRDWYRNDSLLAVRPVSDKSDKTPFVLRTRKVSMSVTGSMANVTKLLSDFSDKKQLVHVTSFTMQKSEQDDMVELELEMLLIELAKPQAKRASA